MEAAIVIIGLIALAMIVAAVVMVLTWGLAGAFIRVTSVTVALLLAYAAVKWRRRWAAAAKESYGRYQASRPHCLQGNFPRKASFFGPGTTLSCNRGSLQNPLVYAVADGTDMAHEPSLIAAGHLVAPTGTPAAELPYWPSYHVASPAQRAIYVDWLMAGRKAMPPAIGYAFIFFYGLERRLLLDKADHVAIFDEVLRLRQLNAADQQHYSQSFESYTSAFLWLQTAVFAKECDEQRIRSLAGTITSWNEDSLSCLLTWFYESNRPLPDWAAYIIASQLPGSQRSVVVDRVNDEFRRLFHSRYTAQFGVGRAVQSSKRKYKLCYKPASAAIGPVKLEGPNPLGLMSQFRKLSEIWNLCIVDLRKLSSVVRKQAQQEPARTASQYQTNNAPPPIPETVGATRPQQAADTELTPDAWEALPREIRDHTDHPLSGEICSLVAECTNEEGRTIIPVDRLASLLGFEEGKRLTVLDSRCIARTAEHVGYCLEPDPYVSNEGYRRDESVTAFLRTMEDETFATRYTAASAVLRFGMVVAAADGNVQPDELAAIQQDIAQMFQLNEQERRRLEALRGLLLAVGPDNDALSRIAQLLTPETAKAIAKLLLVIAAKDGIVTQEEIDAVRNCYRTLGFCHGEIEDAIASLQGKQAADEPVTVMPAMAGSASEPIPAPPRRPVLRLNRAAIAQIMQDTQEVARMLAEAMSTSEPPPPGSAAFTTPFVQVSQPAQTQSSDLSPISPAADPAASSLSHEVTAGEPVSQATHAVQPSAQAPIDPTMPQRYAGFYALLISRQEWETKEIEGLARQQGLMLNGAIDALNEWAAEKYGGQLFVEDGAKLLIEQAYLSQG